MQKVYAPPDIERRIYAHWESHGWFAPRNTGGAPYCIVIPPPNVTGTLHMGHAFQHTLMDVLTRYHRMRGERTLWQPGTDHAGIATQMVVERQLEAEGTNRLSLGREAFVVRVWKWKAHSGGTIGAQMRRLGSSVDWSRERFTMDADLSRAVTEVFVKLHDEGLIYRGKRLVNWDPVLLTALSDLEVQSEEEDGQLWHLRYPFEDGSGYIVVATTRPETMLGDAAVAVNPEDARYRHLIGKTLKPVSYTHLDVYKRQVFDVAHPLEVRLGPVLRHELSAPALDSADRRRGERRDLHVPLIGKVGLEDGAASVAAWNHQPMLLDAFQEARRRKFRDDALARDEAVEPAKARRHVVVECRGGRENVDLRQVVAQSDLVVVEVVRGRDLDAPGAKRGIDVRIGDQWNGALRERQGESLADEMPIARILRVYCCLLYTSRCV